MFKPPPDYKWQQKVKEYENKFRRKVPQWVFTLALEDAARILSTSVFLNYKLPPHFLIAGEILDGCGGFGRAKEIDGTWCQTYCRNNTHQNKENLICRQSK
jgi:hypothetical protein